MRMSRKEDNVFDLASKRTQVQVLESLFAEHGVALRDFLRVHPGLVGDIDDIVQDVFLKLAQAKNLSEKISPRTGSTRAYLFTMANNLVVDRHRKQALQHNYVTEISSQHEERGMVGPERMVQSGQQLEMVKRTLLKMKPMCRKVFLLNRYEAMSYRQISEYMGLSVKQVEKYMSQALLRLRESARRAER